MKISSGNSTLYFGKLKGSSRLAMLAQRSKQLSAGDKVRMMTDRYGTQPIPHQPRLLIDLNQGLTVTPNKSPKKI